LTEEVHYAVEHHCTHHSETVDVSEVDFTILIKGNSEIRNLGDFLGIMRDLSGIYWGYLMDFGIFLRFFKV
jgi:hypothetical protein